VLALPIAGDADAAYPGEAQLLASADTTCDEAFAQAALEQTTGRTVGHITPTQSMWQAGERRIICLAAGE
jgi:hypothetical protein